jgi:tRNA(fMet)-specific endonuclease VapC
VEVTRILLDTSAYSAMRRGDPELKEMLAQAAEVVVTPVVLGELLCGFKKGAREKENHRLLREFLESPRVRMLALDAETAERYAAIWNYLRCEGKPIPVNDLWIAASAAQHGLRLATADEHFERVPHVLVDWLETPGALDRT